MVYFLNKEKLMSYIVLNDNDFLGTGGERNCYIYPRDEKKSYKKL